MNVSGYPIDCHKRTDEMFYQVLTMKRGTVAKITKTNKILHENIMQ